MHLKQLLRLIYTITFFAVMTAISPLSTVQAAVVAPTDTSAAGELAFWNSIKKSESADDFDVYLKAFPDGMFVDVAKTRFQALGGAATAPVVAPPVEAAPAEQDMAVEQPKPKKQIQVIAKAPAKKQKSAVFGKAKKAKQILAYSKARTKAKRTAQVQYKPVKKIKRAKVGKAQYVKTAAPPKVYKKKKVVVVKSYAPSTEAAGGGEGGGGGSGGAGGGGGGWN